MGEEHTRKKPLHSQCDGQYCHQHLIRHRVYNAANHGLQLPPPRDPPIDEICEPRRRKQPQRRCGLVMEYKVANHGRR